jgi:putative endonuclease
LLLVKLGVPDRSWRFVLVFDDFVNRLSVLEVVAEEAATDTIVICEVKTRSSEDFGSPLAAVTPRKVRRLRVLAGEWLRSHDRHARQVRIDVVGILLSKSGAPHVEHLRGVA